MADRSSPSVTPSVRFLVPPATVPEVEYQTAMRTSALFASSLCATEPDGSGDLRPVDRVKPSVLAADWHQSSSSTRERSPATSAQSLPSASSGSSISMPKAAGQLAGEQRFLAEQPFVLELLHVGHVAQRGEAELLQEFPAS